MAARDDIDPLALVSEGRARLAARVGVPPWFAASYAAALVVVFALPATAPGSAGVIAFLAALMVLSMVDAVLSRRAGFEVPLTDPDRFPSVRGPRNLLLVVLVIGSLATWWTADRVGTTISLATGVLVTLSVCQLRFSAVRAVRRDLAGGRAT